MLQRLIRERFTFSPMRRLIHRLVVLAVLTAALVFISFGPAETETSAALCCSTCSVSLENCLHNCASQPSTCNFCYGTYGICQRICDPLC